MEVSGASTSSSIAQFYKHLTGVTLRGSLSESSRNDPSDDVKLHDDHRSEDHNNDEDDDIEDSDTRNDEPCDLRLLTPTTCLHEMYPTGNFAAHSSASMVPYLGGAALAETLMSNLTKLPGYKNSPAGTSTGSSVSGGLPTGAATIPPLRNIRVSVGASGGQSSGGTTGGGGGSSSSGGGTGGSSNQTTPGGAYSCHRCGNSYARPHSLNRHIRFECGVEPKFECPVCHKKSKHKHNLVLHMRTHQQR